MRRAGLMVALLCATASVARAQDTFCPPPPPETVVCDGGTVGVLRDYLHVANAGLGDTRASFTACGFEVRLRGWWFTPPDTKKKTLSPTLIYLHGSEEMADAANERSAKCAVVEAFTQKGMAVFVPHRRGHGKSTGEYFEDYADRAVSEACTFANDPSCKVLRRETTMRYLNEQADDVEAAFRTVAAYPGVDIRKMSIMGHSFGGQVTLFTNARRLGQKAAIAFAPGSESWEGDPCLPDGDVLPSLCSAYPRGVLQEFLYGAVDLAKSPLFFFDVQNDVSVKGVYELPYWGWSNTRALHQATLFRPVAGLSCRHPDAAGNPVTCGVNEPTKVCPADPETGEIEKCGNVAHSASATDPTEIAKWVPAVLEFLERYGAR